MKWYILYVGLMNNFNVGVGYEKFFKMVVLICIVICVKIYF